MAVKTAIKPAAKAATTSAKSGNGKAVQRKVLPNLFTTLGTIQRKEKAGSWVHSSPQKPVNRRPVVQPKVKIHPSNDRFEKEADKVADKVIANERVAVPSVVSRVSSGAQKKCSACEAEEKKVQACHVQRKCSACAESESVQTKGGGAASSASMLRSGDSSPPATDAHTDAHPLDTVLSDQSTRGSPLPSPVRNEMGNRMGADFNNVRIHTNSASHQATASIGARAFTHGANIYFASGEFNPHTQTGKHLLAHELTHTIQQGASQSGVQRAVKDSGHSPEHFSITHSMLSTIANEGGNRGPPVQRQPAEGCVQCALIDTAVARIGELLNDLPSITEGLTGAKNWLMRKMRQFASFIPGYRAMGVVLGHDPITGEHIERNGRAFIEAALDIIPGGSFLKRKLEEIGAIDRAAAWIDTQIESLSGIIGNIRDDFEREWNNLGLTSVLDGPINILRRFGGIFERGINNLLNFARRAASELLEIVKQFLLTQLVNFVKNHTNAYELLKVILGRDPITNEPVARNGTNILNALLELGGEQGREQRRQMQDTGTFQKAADWIDRGIAVFSNLYDTIRNNVGLIWNAVSIESLMEPVATFNRIYETFAAPVRQVLDFVADTLRVILGFIKEALLQRLSAWARTIRGYPLITVIIGKDPFTNQVVPRTIPNIIRGFMSLMEGGEEQYRQMEESGAIARVTQRINAAVARLNMTPAVIVQLFVDLWNSFSFSDLAHPIDAFNRIMARFGEPISRLIAFVIEIVKIMVETIMQIMNFPTDLIANIINRAMAAIERIKRDPIGFLKNLLRAIKQGFIQFFNNILTHLRNGLVGWLMSELRDANVPAPQDFSLRGIIGWVLQVLGISMESIWQKLAAHPRIGPERVARIRSMIDRLEGIWTFIRDVQQRGVAAIWDKIQEQLSNLWNTVLDAVKNWIMERIVNQVTARLLSMLDPTGIMAVINSAIAIYRAIQSFVRYLRQMLEVVNSFVNGVADIAEGNVTTAANYMERTMSRAMPIVIGFLANQVGLSGIGRRIGEMVGAVRQMVDRALTWLVNRAVDTGFAVFDRLLSMGRSAVGAVAEFLGLRKQFTTSAGESHTISVEEQNGQAELMIASRKRTYLTRVREIVVDPADTAKVTAKSDAENIAIQIDQFLKRPRQDRSRNRATLEGLINNLTAKTSLILPPEQASLIVNVNDIIRINSPTGSFAKVTQVTPDRVHFETLGFKRNTAGVFLLSTLNINYWKSSEEALELPMTQLDELNKLEVWSNIRIARAILNWRRSGQQRNRDTTKQWEHKIENRTRREDIHSTENLYWTDADFNQWLNHEMARIGRKRLVIGDQLRILSYREYLNIVNTEAAHREVKEALYRQRGYREEPKNDPQRGSWNELVQGTPASSTETEIQTKLKHNASSNHLEREADAVADSVTSDNKGNSRISISKATTGVQRKTDTTTSASKQNEKINAVITTNSTRGSPLPSTTRKEMESRIGADFSNVRIHTGAASHQANASMGARAFTTGGNIHFANGEFDPATKTGKHLLAHELTHTVQQGAVPTKPMAPAPAPVQPNKITGLRKVVPKVSHEKKIARLSSPHENRDASKKQSNEEFSKKFKNKKAPKLPGNALKKDAGKKLHKEPVALPKKEEKKKGEKPPKPALKVAHLQNARTQQSQLGQLAAGGITFKPEPDKQLEESPVHQTQRLQSRRISEGMLAKAATSATVITAFLSQVRTRLTLQSSAAITWVKTNEAAQKEKVKTEIKAQKEATKKAKQSATGSISGYHKKVTGEIKAATTKAKADILLAKTLNTVFIELAALLQIPKIDKAYTDAKKDFEASGRCVGNKCYSRQSQRSWDEFISKMKHEDDSWYDGPYTDDIKEAKGNAAVKVGEGYKDAMIKAGTDQAAEIEKGKPNDLKKVADAKTEMLGRVAGSYDTSLKAIEAAQKNSLSQADSTKKSMLGSVWRQHKAAQSKLDLTEKTQLQFVEILSLKQSQQIELQSEQAAEAMEEGGSQSLAQLNKSFKDYKQVMESMNSPPPLLLQQKLQPIEASLSTAAPAMITSLQRGMDLSTAGFHKTANETIATTNTTVTDSLTEAKGTNTKAIDGLKKLQQAAITALQGISTKSKKTIADTDSQCVTNIQNVKTYFDGTLTNIETDLKSGLKTGSEELKKGLQSAVDNGTKENPSMQKTSEQEEEKAADQVEPRWKSVLKVLLVIVVVLVVALVVGPAVIGFIGAAAGGGAFGAAVGAVVGGAILGAASSAVITIGNNLIDGKTWYQGVGHAMLEGAITGAIGGAFGAAGGGLAGKLIGTAAKGVGPALGRFAIQQGVDFAGNIVTEYASSKLQGKPFSWTSVAQGQAIGAGMHIGMGGLGALKDVKGFKTVNNIMESSAKAGEKFGGAVKAKVTGTPKIEPHISPSKPTIEEPLNKGPSAKEEIPVAKPAEENLPAVKPREEPVSAVPKEESPKAKAPEEKKPANLTQEEVADGIIAKYPTEDGHHIKLTENGMLVKCSTCEHIDFKNYRNQLPESKQRKFSEEWNTIQKETNPDVKVKKTSEFDAKLQSELDKHMSEGAKIARENGLPPADDGYHWKDNGSDTPTYSKNPGHTGPEMIYNKQTGKLEERPVGGSKDWQAHENKVDAELRAKNPGAEIRKQGGLKVTLSDGTVVEIHPDNLMKKPNGEFQIVDAKHQQDALIASGQQKSKVTENQSKAYPEITQGKATATAAYDMPELGVRKGDPIPLSKDIRIHTNDNAGNIVDLPFK